jgi:hypothetical protein
MTNSLLYSSGIDQGKNRPPLVELGSVADFIKDKTPTS